MSTISIAEYTESMRILKQAVDALDPREMTQMVVGGFTQVEGDRARVVKAVADLKDTVAAAYVAALQARG